MASYHSVFRIIFLYGNTMYELKFKEEKMLFDDIKWKALSTPIVLERKFGIQNNHTQKLSDAENEIEKVSCLNNESPNKNEDVINIMGMPPGQVKFSEMSKKMEPVIVDGLEHIKDVLGYIKNENIISSDSVPNKKLDSDFTQTNYYLGKPLDKSVAWAKIELYLEGQDRPIDKDEDHDVQMITLSEDSTLPGILLACRWLLPGQCGLFLLPPQTMQGAIEKYPNIPKSATILMVVHLLYWIDAEAPARYDSLNEVSKKNLDDIKSLIEVTDHVASTYYKNKKYSEAANVYEKLISMLNGCEFNETNDTYINNYNYKTFINMALCNMKLNKPSTALSALDKASALGDWKHHSKYLYVRGACMSLLNNYEEAMTYLLKALDVAPNNEEIGRELIKIDDICAKHKKDSAALWLNKFNTDKMKPDIQPIDETVAEFCKVFKNMEETIIPVPPLLLSREIDYLESAIEKVYGVSIITKDTSEGLLKFFQKNE